MNALEQQYKQSLYDSIYFAKKECFKQAMAIGKRDARNKQFEVLKAWLRANRAESTHYKVKRADGLKNAGDFLRVQKERKLNEEEFSALCFYMCFRQEFLNYVSCSAKTSVVQHEFDLLFDPYLNQWNSAYSDFKGISLQKSIF